MRYFSLKSSKTRHSNNKNSDKLREQNFQTNGLLGGGRAFRAASPPPLASGMQNLQLLIAQHDENQHILAFFKYDFVISYVYYLVMLKVQVSYL